MRSKTGGTMQSNEGIKGTSGGMSGGEDSGRGLSAGKGKGLGQVEVS